MNIAQGSTDELKFEVSLEASNVFCVKDGTVLQLWVNTGSRTPHEWRPLPDFADAQVMYGCEKISKA